MIGATARPALRLARRNLLRDRWRAVLIVVLIGIPVFGMTAGTLILATVSPTPDERASLQLGSADLRVWPVAATDPELLADVLPAGSTVEATADAGDAVIVPGTTVPTGLWFQVPGGLAAGRTSVIEGRAPVAAGEIAITPMLARRTGGSIGSTLQLRAQGPVTVVGVVEVPQSLSATVGVLADPSRAPEGSAYWLVSLPPGTDRAAAAEAVDAARPGDLDPAMSASEYDAQTRDQLGEASEMWITFVFVLGALALVEAALVASAAFAVGIRRRQRDLGLLGASGATPRDMATVLLAEGLTAGAVATLFGIMAGIAAAFVAGPWLDSMVDRRVGPVVLDPLMLGVAAVIGMGAALIAAVVPAWSAARLPTLVALSGRRPPSAPAHRLLTVGAALIAVALACTIGAPLVARGGGIVVPLGLLVVGSIAGVLGFGACSPWLLERLDRPARRLPLAARIAVRDTSRARTRNGPIVTAVLASVAGMIALASLLASSTAYGAAQWQPPIPVDVMLVQGDTATTLGPTVADAVGVIASGPDRMPLVDGFRGSLQVQLASAQRDADGVLEPTWVSDLVIGDESMLQAIGGASALEAFRTGAVVLFPTQAVSPVDHVSLELLDESYVSTGTTFEVAAAVVPLADPRARNGMPQGIVPEDTAARLGLVAESDPTRYTIRLGHAVTQADLDHAAALMPADGSVTVTAPLRPEDGTIGFRMLLLVASLVVALSVTGVAVALGETEARPDQRTLLTLGADRRLRRRVTAARGAVLAGLAGVLAVPAGLLPVWGVLLNTDWPIVVPVPELLAAILVLPLMAVAGGLLLGRPLDERAPRMEVSG